VAAYHPGETVLRMADVVAATGRPAVIASLGAVAAALRGEAETTISPPE
jgi:hypothetical protein